MYFYLYDATLAEKRNAGKLADIETHLTDLGLQGRIGRLGPLKSAAELVRGALKAGAKTIVAVGNDRTVAEAVNAMAGGTATLGIIPIGKPTAIARLLGIPSSVAAVAVLAARKTETLDLGKLNSYYFLTTAVATSTVPLKLTADTGFTVQPTEPGAILAISNLAPEARCQDGYLEATIELPAGNWWGKRKRRSVVPLKSGKLTAEAPAAIMVEGIYSVNLPAVVEIIPGALKVIVGKNRVF